MRPWAVLQRTCVGDVYDRLLFHTRMLLPGDDPWRLVEQVAQPELLPGDVIILSSRAVSACQGRLRPLSTITVHHSTSKLARLWSRYWPASPWAHPAAWQLAIEDYGWGSVALAAWRYVRRRPDQSHVSFLRVGKPADLPVYRGQLILPPQDAAQLARSLWLRSGYRTAVVSVSWPNRVQIAGMSYGLSPDMISDLMLDNPLGDGSQQTPIAILRKRRGS